MKKIIISLVLISVVIGFFMYRYVLFGSSKNINLFNKNKIDVVIDCDLVEDKDIPLLKDDEILLTIEFIKEHIDSNILWDEKEKKVTITTKDKVIRMKSEDLEAMVNNNPVDLTFPVKEEKGKVYIPIDFLKDFYNIELSFLEENKVLVIDNKSNLEQVAKPMDNNAVIRRKMSISQPIVKKLIGKNEENYLKIYEEYNKWYKVRAKDGVVGFILKKDVVVLNKMVKYEEEIIKNDDKSKEKISLAWHATYTENSVIPVKSKIDGLDILVPTWFEIRDKEGSVLQRVDEAYVKRAHSQGYKVWALFNNDFNDKEKTHEFLNSTSAREKAISEILMYSMLYKLDGINIDFENLMVEDKNNLTQFVRELYPILKEQGLILSIDVNTAGYFDKKVLSNSVDYMVIMAYDQHWKGGGKAGSVAQYEWVEDIIKVFTVDNNIPSNKIILGIPFYTRNWKVNTNTGSLVSSEAMSMEKSMKLVETNKSKISWDTKSAQFYSEYNLGSFTYKMWIEEHNSINWKSSLVHKYKLAGTGAWKLNFEVEAVWDVLYKNLKITKNYDDWESKNKEKKPDFIISKKYNVE